jgi:hypothetical protein
MPRCVCTGKGLNEGYQIVCSRASSQLMHLMALHGIDVLVLVLDLDLPELPM